MKLRFTIRDTGIGIPKDKTALLFNKFSQVDASMTRKYGGTGLGLAISKQLAEMMGGEIGVCSLEGQGSEFWFTARFELQEGNAGAEMMRSRDLAGLHVLVVDDNATNMEILLKQLAGWGMRPLGAQGGTQALEAAAMADGRGDHFDLAVVDYQMPGMDGGELGTRLKADPRFQDIPLVMLTSLGRPGDARMCAELGFSAYLNKPVRGSELHDTLALVMADTGRRDPSQPIITRHMARENQRRQSATRRFSGRILLAEDNLVNQQVVLGMLKKMGLSADTVPNGREALHALQTIPYDLVLMDVMMPEMDGLEATRRIRKEEGGRKAEGGRLEPEVGRRTSDIGDRISDPQVSGLSPQSFPPLHPSPFTLQRPRRLPVIALTAGAMQQDRERCLEAGMDDYLAKPINPVELARVLERWLPEDRGQRSEIRGQEPKEERPLSEDEEQAGTDQDLPVFDRAALLNRCMGDEDLVRDVLSIALENIPQRIQELQAALDADDAPAARMAAHTLKGMAANIGAEALRALAGKMENAAKSGELKSARGELGDMRKLFGQLLAVSEDR